MWAFSKATYKRDRPSRGYLFDFHASSAKAARSLTDAVVAEAMKAGIDYCYIPHRAGTPWVAAVRSKVPSLFTPVLPYSILARTVAGEPLSMQSPYINIQDL